jgi:hypothetical protein
MNQIQILKNIDQFFTAGLEKAESEHAQKLIEPNLNARDYLFSEAPIEWIEWLNENGFFEALNQEAEDKTRYSFSSPELYYLIRVVEQGGNEDEVVRIMNQVQCDKNFNPEVIDQFIHISQRLSVENLIKITPKIKKENWVKLMSSFGPSGYSYQEIVKKLDEAGEYGSLVELADSLFSINEKKDKNNYLEHYFHLGDIHESGIFKALANAKGEEAKTALIMISQNLPKLTEIKEEDGEVGFFTASDKLYLGDLDFFNLKFRESGLRYKEDIESLLTLFGLLIEKVIGSNCQSDAKEIFDAYIKKLPNTQALWRMKLFAMSQCLQVFSDEIKRELNRIFDKEMNYSHLLQGTEYLNTLKNAFSNWNSDDQSSYIKNLLNRFKALIEQEPDEYYHPEQGWEIASCIASELSTGQQREFESLFGKKLDPNFKPEAIRMQVATSSVEDRSPVDFSKEEYADIQKVLQDLSSSLAPKKSEK